MVDTLTQRDDCADVIVVGAGNAALTAALAAKEQGVSVTVIEKAPIKHRGGNTRFTGGLFRCTYNGIDDLRLLIGKNDEAADILVDPYTASDFRQDVERVTGGRADVELTETLIDSSYATVRWMADLGVAWEFNRAVGPVRFQDSPRIRLARGAALRAKGEGVILSSTLFRLAMENNITILYETEAEHLVLTEDGHVCGVSVQSAKGSTSLHCRALVLASGGFQGNATLRTTHLGPGWDSVKVRGTPYNTGEMTLEALSIGAASYGEWSGCHATPIDAAAPPFGDLRLTDKTNRLSYPYGVMINLDGERFVDEGEDFNLYTYARMGREILRQREAIVFQVFDEQTYSLLEKRYNTAEPIVAQSLKALADDIATRYHGTHFDKDCFIKTLDDYNDAVQDGSFNPGTKDGKCTKGLRPEKTNWAIRLDRPPFYAFPSSLGITFTFGGLRINRQAAVLDRTGDAIPGLYATGEATGGFFYGNYPGGAGLMRGAVFGKLAGTHSAIYARGT